MRIRILASITLAAALLGASGAAQANLISNGSFESGSFSGWATAGLTCSGVGTSYQTAAPGCYGLDTDPGAHGGTYAAYFGTYAGGGTISQTFATVAGQGYQIDFWLSIGAYGGTSVPNSFQALVGGASLLSLVNAPAQGYTHYTLNYTATGSSTTLSFIHGDQPSFFILDDVAARAVPEPSVLALLGLGLAGLGLARRRRT